MRIGHLPSGLGRKLATVAVLCSALVAGSTATVPAYAAATVAADAVGDPPLADYGDDVPADDDPSRVSASAVSTTAIPCDANGSDKTLTRAQVLARARTWLDVWVPYSQERCYRNSLGDYRTDCSGYVSMAWGIGGSGSGIWTGNMTSKTSTIARSALKPGDALLRYTGSPSQNHVALFVRWADDAQTRPYVYEQRGSRGTVASTWSASKASAYTPVRYDNIIDVAPQPAKERTVGDYNGDGQTDRALYRPSTGEWRIQYYRTNGTAVYTWGSPGDVPVPGDYNGDGQNDRAVYRPSTGQWLIQYYRTNGTAIWKWGSPGDVPAVGDYNGDGQFDRAVFRPSTGQWLIQYYRTNGTATWTWGASGDIPVTAS